MTLVQTKEQAVSPPVKAPVDAPRQVAERYGDPDWLLQLRQEAWERYSDLALPDRTAHLWRYTDPAQFVLRTEAIVPQERRGGQAVQESHGHFKHEHHAAEIICQNGALVLRQIDPALESQGVLLTDLHTAAREHPDRVKEHLGQIVGSAHGKFEALNLALWQGGVFLYVPRGVVIDRPVHVVVTGDEGSPLLAPRLLVVLDEGAQATLVDEYASPRPAGFDANGIVELALRPAANLRYVTLQRWGEQVTAFFTQRAVVKRDAQMLAVWAGLGGSVVKADLGSALAGRGANAKLLGMSFAQHRQHFDQHTVHDHRVGDTYSDLDFKIVLKDKARSAYTGLIRIAQQSQNCEAYQENRNLLLSDQCRVETIPELEILNDEVRCSHGATVGPVDEEMLYYLASRGIPRADAIRMVISGFVEPTFLEVPEDLRDRLRSYVMERVKKI